MTHFKGYVVDNYGDGLVLLPSVRLVPWDLGIGDPLLTSRPDN